MRAYMVKKTLGFILSRALEATVFYFFYQFAVENFEGIWFQVSLGVMVGLYLLYVGGTYVDDYRERHRYDDVIV